MNHLVAAFVDSIKKQKIKKKVNVYMIIAVSCL